MKKNQESQRKSHPLMNVAYDQPISNDMDVILTLETNGFAIYARIEDDFGLLGFVVSNTGNLVAQTSAINAAVAFASLSEEEIRGLVKMRCGLGQFVGVIPE